MTDAAPAARGVRKVVPTAPQTSWSLKYIFVGCRLFLMHILHKREQASWTPGHKFMKPLVLTRVWGIGLNPTFGAKAGADSQR